MTKRKDPALFVRIRPWQERFADKLSADGTSCWVWTGAKNARGYGVFNAGKSPHPLDAPVACEPRRNVPELAHRFAYKVARGEPVGECLMHTCDRPECVNPWHMRDGTLAENNADMFAKGRSSTTAERSERMKRRAARGERQPCAKLTDASVRRIRAMRAAGATYADICRAVLGRTGTNAVRDVCVGRTWRHVA